MPLEDQDPDVDTDCVSTKTSISRHVLISGRSPELKLDESLKQEAQSHDATNCQQSGCNPSDILVDSKRVTTTSSVTSRRRCIDIDPVDRPEASIASTNSERSGRTRDLGAHVILQKSPPTRPSPDHGRISEDRSVLLYDDSTLRPGVVAVSGVRNASMGPSSRRPHTLLVGDRTEQQAPNTDPNGNGPKPPVAVTAAVALCGGTAADVEQGGPIQAQLVDEEEYRQRIESDYRDRLLQQAAIDVSTGIVKAVEEKDTPLERGLCSLSRRTASIAIIVAILMVVGLIVGVTVGVTRPTPTLPPTDVASNSTIPPTPILSCEERCNLSSALKRVEAQGQDFKRAILLYLEGKVMLNDR
jgi:hypothetical protein